MGKQLNALADAYDQLSGYTSMADLWSKGLHLFEGVGSSHLTFGTAAISDLGAPIVKTNMPTGLMDSYVSEKIYEHDPWMEHCAITAQTSHLDVCSGVTSGHTNIQNTMCSMFEGDGVFQVSLFPCSSGPRVGGIVLYSSHREIPYWQRDEDGRAYTQILVALFGARYRPEAETDPSDQLYLIRQPLTVREREVLKWLANGLRTTEIAYKMKIAEVTVHKHLRTLRRKLNARTREQAVAIALRDSLLTL